MTRDEVLKVLRDSVEATNRFHGEQKISFALETPLFGKGASLDSLDLVSFLIEVETRLAQEFGQEYPLSDDRAMSQARSPFRTIGTLAEYILALGAEPNG